MTAAEWDITVPADEAELLAELRSRGVRPGSRLHVVVSQPPADVHDVPEFFGSFAGPADLAEGAEDILNNEFPSRSR